MKPANRLRQLTGIAGLFFATASLTAQKMSAPHPSASGGNSEVITLGTFEVSSANNHGYTSDQTTTGTRVAVNLRDLPFSVNVVTSDFIKDFAAFEFNDQVSNVSSLSISEVQGQYQLRGFGITTQLVDGFRRLGLIDPVNIDRIEVIKGPAASIYGYIQPGGVVNILTKKPLAHRQEDFSVSVGDYDFFRAQASSTGPIGKKLYYRVDLSDSHRDFQQLFKAQSRSYEAVQLLFKPDENSSLNLKVDNVFQHEHRGNQLIYLRTTGIVNDPYRVVTSGANKGLPQTISGYFQGLAYANNPYNARLYNFNVGGPGEYNDRSMESATATFEHRINDIFSLRDGFNYFKRHYYRLYVDGLNYQINGAGAGLIGVEQPEYDNEPQQNIANQLDLVAKFDLGPLSNRMLLTFDYSGENDRFSEMRMDATTAALQPINGPLGLGMDPNNPNYNFTNEKKAPALYDQPQQNYADSVHDYGIFLNEHGSMFNHRLNFIAGGRFDWIDTKLSDYSAYSYSTGTLGTANLRAHIHHLSQQLGVSYRLADPVTVYVNQSTSLNPQPNYIPGTGQMSPNSTADGYEFGAKLGLLQNRLSITVAHYDINQHNNIYQISTSENLINPTTLQAFTASVTGFMDIPVQESKGEEIDLNWSATKSLQLGADYSYDEATIRKSDPHYLYLQGTSTRRVPQNQFAAAARYDFRDGFLKGLFFVVRETSYSKSSVNVSGGRTATSSGWVNNPNPNGTLPFAIDNVPAGAPVPLNYTTRLTPTSAPGTAVPDPSLIHLPDGREQIFNRPYWLTDVGIGYHFKTGRFGHRLQFNLKNAFARKYTYGSGIAGDPLSYVGTYTLTF